MITKDGILISIIILLAVFNLPSLTYAQAQPVTQEATSSGGQVIDANSYNLLQQQEIITNELKNYGQIDSNFIKTIAKIDFSSSNITETPRGYVFTTGRNGLAVANIQEGAYEVILGPLSGVDLKVPSIVVVGSGEVLVPILAHSGTGKVEKSVWKVTEENNQNKKNNLTKVTVAIFNDENNNGVVDKNETFLPLGGVAIALKKTVQTKSFNFLPGWNLITLTALPGKPLTASLLIEDINKQGGEVTTVSTLENGVWKSYVARDGDKYSLADFPIEPGKAYFVKSLRFSIWNFTGQEFVAPIKLSLKEGWNAVGMPVTSKEYKAASLIDNLNNSQAQASTLAAFTSGLWDTFVKHDREEYGNNFIISKNQGYILKVGKNLEFSP